MFRIRTHTDLCSEPGGVAVPGFHNDDERAAWVLAETLLDKARSMMRNADEALERWREGKDLMTQRCARRGISESDAEIRWAESAGSKNALSDNSFHVSLAMMYYGAAAAHYSRAAYLRSRREARI
jgi:hypothetical protein